jgi:hypothetical protein
MNCRMSEIMDNFGIDRKPEKFLEERSCFACIKSRPVLQNERPLQKVQPN